jgi:PucR C-terminal helix-turn-helix domain/GGDEF-like domain
MSAVRHPGPEPRSAMSVPGDRARPPRAILAAEISEVAGSVTARLPDLADRVVERILAEIEFYRDRDVVARDDLRNSVISNLESLVEQLTTDRQPDLSAPRATGRRRAEQGTPLADILHAYRIGFTELWEAIVDEARRGQAAPETLVDAASGVWWLIGEYTQELTVAYRETAAELLLARARERSALVEALFMGGIPDRDTLWEAAKLLRLPWEGLFVVVAAEAPGLAQEGLPDVEALLAARGIGSAWRLHPDIQTGVVSLRHRDALSVLLGLLGGGVRARAGVSAMYHSLEDTPRALHYARLVLGSLPAGSPVVAQFEETPLRVLAAAAPDAARALAHTVLGPVLDLPAHDRSSLLTTLQAWFDAAGSAVEAGKRIYCHPNTVRYRLRRLQEHTGRSLDDPRAVAELLAALDALRLTHGTTWQGER